MAVPVSLPYSRAGVGSTAPNDKPIGKSFTGFLKAVQDDDQRTIEKVYETGWVSDGGTVKKTAMGESSGGLGGYNVPSEYTTKLLNVISDESFVWQRATVIPMERQQINFPRIDVETIPAATGTSPFFGGIKFAWSFESTSPPETEPQFRQLSLTAWDLIGEVLMSNQFLGDTGPAGEEALIKLFGKAAAWYAEYAFFNGLGAGDTMPLGILKCPALITVAADSGDSSGLISLKDVTNMTSKLLPYSWGNAIWAIHPGLIPSLQQISTYLINVELGDLHKKAPTPAGVLATRPVFITEKLPASGSAVTGSIVLFDPTLYVIGMRQQVVISASSHPNFTKNQTWFKVWLRCDGRPQVSGAITLQDKATVVSPYITLTLKT